MGGQLSKVIRIDNVDETDVVIAIIGHSGVGRSTFINCCVRRDILPVRRSQKPETREIQHVGWLVQNNNQTQRVILVEVPGPDVIAEKKLRDWLGKLFSRRIKISGVIHLHRITNDKFSFDSLELLARLCEESMMVFPKRVALVTTMWNEKIAGSVANSRVNELQKAWDNSPWAKRSSLSEIQHFNTRSPEIAADILSRLMTETEEENIKDQKEAMKVAIAKEREAREAAERAAKEANDRLVLETQRFDRERIERQARERVEKELREELELDAIEAQEREEEERRAKEREAREAREARQREAEERKAREALEEQLRETRRLMEMERRLREVELKEWAVREQKARAELLDLLKSRGKADAEQGLIDRLERELGEVKQREMRAREVRVVLEREIEELKERELKALTQLESLMKEAKEAREAEMRERKEAEKAQERLAQEVETREAVEREVKIQESKREEMVREALAHEQRVWNERLYEAWQLRKREMEAETQEAMNQLEDEWAARRTEAIEQEHMKWKATPNLIPNGTRKNFDAKSWADQQELVRVAMTKLNTQLTQIMDEWNEKLKTTKREEESKFAEKQKVELERMRREWVPRVSAALDERARELREF